MKERARCIFHIPKSIILIGRRFLWIKVFHHERQLAIHMLAIKWKKINLDKNSNILYVFIQ
jgi:hypothetical protein